MTQIQWQQLEATVAEMTDDEKRRLAAMLADAASCQSSSSDNPSLGLFADDPDLLDEIMDGVYIARENHPFRTGK